MSRIERTPGISPTPPSPERPQRGKLPSQELKSSAEKIKGAAEKHRGLQQVPISEKKHSFQAIPSNPTITSKVRIASHRAL